jgi:hypothetical protein
MTSETSIDTADVLAVDATVMRTTGSPQYGLTQSGFVAKPFARLLAEKLALARALFGNDLDLSSGSVLRKLFEVTALEDARTWAALSAMYDNSFVSSATGEALSRLGEELGLLRPHLEARGTVSLKLEADLPANKDVLNIPRGARLLTPGGHHVATDETVALSAANPEREITVVAFYPGPAHNLNPTVAAPDGTNPQKVDRWNLLDPGLGELRELQETTGSPPVAIEHTQPLTGGELLWPDARYRQLLLQAPRSVWRVEAISVAVSLVPGVRQVVVRDALGGLDIHQSIFGNFNFIERVFGTERDLASPYYFTILVAPTPAAIWDGPDGLRASIESAIQDLRPLGVFPRIERADEVGTGIAADLIVSGLPLPRGSQQVINDSPPAQALKQRLLERVQLYVDSLGFGQPVRSAEAIWAMMNEPGVVDVRNLRLLLYPPSFAAVGVTQSPASAGVQEFGAGQNVELQVNQIPVFVDDATRLRIV